jgi:hypothetical protein
MRLEFHPKVETGPGRIVYLLDEPGSYLHARAQDQLCVKLRELARGNTVLYCTHSHHLLDPKVIPFNSIRIVEKDPHKSIRVMSVFDHDTGRRKDAAFQPILEALQVRPGTLDTSRQAVVVVEGLYDFFCFSRVLPDLAIIPAVSAHAIQYHLSWLMAWGVDYRALWDNDEEGRKKFDAARKLFGDHEADLRFRLLPLPKDKKKCRLEDLFTAEDLATMRRLSGVPENAKFEKSVLAAYYSSDRSQIVEEVSNATKRNFQRVKDLLWK